jgi:hypothetical protein
VVARNAVQAMVGYDGLCVWWESGVRWLFFVGRFGRNLASVGTKVFLHLIYVTKKFDKFCTFSIIILSLVLYACEEHNLNTSLQK